jgi:hypothetical protein
MKQDHLFIGLNTIYLLKVVTRFQFGYQSFKICNVPYKVSRIFSVTILSALSVKPDGICNPCVARDFFHASFSILPSLQNVIDLISFLSQIF